MAKIPHFIKKLDPKIKLIGTKNILINIHSKKKVSYHKIAKSIGLSESAYRHYMQEKKHPPIWFIKKLEKIKPKIFYKLEKENLKFTARKDEVKLPRELSPNLAYVLGYLHGDGYLGSDKKTIGFNDEYKEQLEKINDLFYRLFRKKGKIRKVKSPIGKKGSYTLEIRQYVINSFFHVVLRMIRGYKNHLEIPKLIIKNKPLLKNYLIGLYDADGTLPKNPETVKQNFIDVAVKSQHLMKQVKKAVESFGVLTLKLYPRKSRKCFCQSIKKESIIWELRIRRKKAIIRFLKEIGFNHPEKSKRALHLLKKMDP